MTNTTLVEEVLKTDRLGRVKTPVDRREALLDEYERGGMSGQAFAGHYGIKYQTFASWVQKRRSKGAVQEVAPKSAGSLRLMEAVIEAGSVCRESGKTVLRVELPGGASLEVANSGQAVIAAQLLRALAEAARPC